ncbi:hypothetical protein MMC11_005359 [Xylographa trunciseda]|nr:hypothetical protein [Xylographa trunciseda]
MPTNFLNLPSEIRNNIYEQLLVLQEPVVCLNSPWLGYSYIRALTPGLLLANKTVHHEASSLLYSLNRFDFTNCTSKHVVSFLEQIGRNNANYIRHICVDFPEFHFLDLHDVTLTDDSVGILAKFQSDCNKLGTLTTSLQSTNTMELKLDALDHPKIVAKAMALVNARFRAISTLQEIIVEVCEDGPNDYIRREMKGHGWTIRVIEDVEESGSDRSFGNSEEFDHGYDNDSGNDEDKYDIDNDSDFWRRAAD